MASSSTSSNVEPDADDGVAEELVLISYLLHWLIDFRDFCCLSVTKQLELMPIYFLSWQHFDDFTIASSWERFISEIEAVCRIWMADGPKRLSAKVAVPLGYSKNSYKVKSELKYATKSYCMEYYFETNNNGKPANWRSDFHDLQLCFGVKEFLVIAPQSASSAVLDAPEASKLLSAVAIALSNCSSLWPAFVPVNGPARKAYIGIQNTGTVFNRRFEADQIGSQVPIRLMHLEGLYELFVSKFAYTTLDLSTHLFKVQLTMKLTYRMLPYDDNNIKGIDTQNTKCEEILTSETSSETLWDKDCPWSEWYSAEDPVKGFELITIWSEKMVESSTEMAELENASPYEAEKWLISPICALKLFEDSKWNQIGFASQLHLLVDALKLSFEAQFMENFVSADDNSGSENLKSSMVIPPTVSDRVLKELFQEGRIQHTDSAYGGHKTSRAIKGAPLESLFAQFCLRCLWFGDFNIRAIAVLWIEFVREVRWCWEESQLIPRMPANGSIDLSTCLINQKLQMLAACIEKKYEMNEDYQDCIGSEHQIESMAEMKNLQFEEIQMRNLQFEEKEHHFHYPPSPRRHPYLLQFQEKDHNHHLFFFIYKIKLHNNPPPHHDTYKIKLSLVIISYKINLCPAPYLGINEKLDKIDIEIHFFQVVCRPYPKLPPLENKNRNQECLGGNEAEVNENDVPSPETVLHYLETLQPHQLLEQMVCTAFRAAADTLTQTSYGELKQMETMMQQLYLTMAPALRPLQENRLSADSETIEDLRRLCVVFQHVEKLLTLAASLHRKFLQAPRLAREIFSDFYNFYIPRMGIGLTEDALKKGFDKKQEVWNQEREVVSNMFVQPTANQSWRKVLSMGNLINGHEPMKREIIFSMHDDGANGNHYATHTTTSVCEQKIETYRMYICGTSNDLRVALSVVSSD
uniref:Rab3 GTPase-activating protein catalytic subunit n=1 Tax=Cajanus cajan TaxID=3821 RepID=A0A151R1M7_CAJCA|nr:Rab3 GTPase-activating protein catalytic subunit [Cajanus cajan]